MDWSWAVEGITESMPRTTGPECAGFLTTKRKVLEGIVITGISVWALKWTISRVRPINVYIPQSYYQQSHQQHHQYPHHLHHQQQQQQQQQYHYSRYQELSPPIGKQILLVAMTFILGMEMGFKLATKTVIFALNPCHITTIIQIYLLAARPSKTTTALFRIQMNYLNGPFLAFLFPDAESRLLPLEETTYWIQHGLLFIIPIYLLRLGGAYQMEHILDFKWNILAYALLAIYHFTFLQFLAVITNVNLNQMLCASLSDPFEGPNYRLSAVAHQAVLCPFLCKLLSVLFSNTNQIQLDVKIIKNTSHQQQQHQQIYSTDYEYEAATVSRAVTVAPTGASGTSSTSLGGSTTPSQHGMGGIVHHRGTPPPPPPPQPPLIVPTITRIDDQIMTTKID